MKKEYFTPEINVVKLLPQLMQTESVPQDENAVGGSPEYEDPQ